MRVQSSSTSSEEEKSPVPETLNIKIKTPHMGIIETSVIATDLVYSMRNNCLVISIFPPNTIIFSFDG